MDRVGSGIASLAVALSATLLAGCTQQPDAVRLTVTPEKATFARGEPVVIRTRLVGTDGNVALQKSFFYDVELSREGKSLGTTGDRPVYCGTGLVELIPFYPLILVGRLLDVADLSGRFVVITKDKEISQKVLILPGSLHPRDDIKGVFRSGSDVKDADDKTPWDPPPKESLAPGRYHVRVRVINTPGDIHPPVMWYVPPLFWKPYEPTIEAETELTVSE